MNLAAAEVLARLGAGESIPSICRAAGWDEAAFRRWWQEESQSRVPASSGQRRGGVRHPASIERDRWGIPHVFAQNDQDLFFGFGLAMGQDRLFQLDYLRRKGSGRLAEVLGPEGLEQDILARTVGLRRIAEREWTQIPQENRVLLTAFSEGVNAAIEESRKRPPIEFDLLAYRPEPWSPIDCLVIEVEFRWYLTGRFPVIVMPELAKRTLGDGPLYQAWLQRESDQESMVPAGHYPPAASRPSGLPPLRLAPDTAARSAPHRPAAVTPAAVDPDSGQGSNNWVIAGSRTATGLPLVASDPHIAFEAVSCWYEVHLCGGSFNTAGMAYVGMPAVMFGRNEHVAWGCTNNICSQRDLYQERTDPQHPGCFLYDGQWLPGHELEETIAVRGGAPVKRTIQFSHHGPLVEQVLPAAARQTGPVSLRWLGAEEGGWLTALLGMNRARDCQEFRQSLEPWHVPTWCVVFADDQGKTGYQATGRIPLRGVAERGYRPGWEPAHRWQGLIPFAGMPALADPAWGFVTTANHRPAPDDFTYPLSGTWADDYRAARIRQLIEGQERISADDCQTMQMDLLSGRAVKHARALAKLLADHDEPRAQQAATILAEWDGRDAADQIAPTLFHVFFAHWTQMVMDTRFDGEVAALLATGGAGLCAALLHEDVVGWFPAGEREGAVIDAFIATLQFLSQRLGNDLSHWTWGQLHTIPLRHVLSGRGDLGQLLDHGGQACHGGLSTVCNVSPGPDWRAKIGGGYRLVADLATQPPELRAIDAQSQSGHPGSPHYSDQLAEWLAGRQHRIPLSPDAAHAAAVERFVLTPE